MGPPRLLFVYTPLHPRLLDPTPRRHPSTPFVGRGDRHFRLQETSLVGGSSYVSRLPPLLHNKVLRLSLGGSLGPTLAVRLDSYHVDVPVGRRDARREGDTNHESRSVYLLLTRGDPDPKTTWTGIPHNVPLTPSIHVTVLTIRSFPVTLDFTFPSPPSSFPTDHPPDPGTRHEKSGKMYR